jgi:SOS-response transcriptional repressor LexA
MTGKDLKQLYNVSGYSSIEFARKLGVSRAQLYVLFRSDVLSDGVDKSIQKDKNLRESKEIYIDRKPASVVYGHSEVADPGSKFVKNRTPYYPNINASAGLGFLTHNGDSEKSYIDIPNSGADFFINIFGDSMYPKYCSGEIVGIRPIEKKFVMFGHAYVIELDNGECYIKYIKKGKTLNHWILASENKNYDDREFHINDLKKIFMIKIVLTKTTI